MFISIITPCYNSSNTLLRTYESLKKQIFKDFEWILVDDCSSDSGATKELILKISHEASFQVKYYFFEENNFASKSISKGCELAVGEYIGILDHDDQYLPNTLIKVKELADKIGHDPSIAGISGRCIDLNGTLIGNKFEQNKFVATNGEVRYKMGIFDELINFTKASILKTVASDIKPGYTYGYFWFTIGKKYKFLFTNEILRIYDTEVATSYTNTTKKEVRYPYNLAESILYQLDAYSPYLKYQPIISLRKAIYFQHLKSKYKLYTLPNPINKNVNSLFRIASYFLVIRKFFK